MLFHFLKKSFANQKKPVMLMIASVAVGTAIAASLITIAIEISGKIARELRSFGANILVEPKIEGLADISEQKRYLSHDDIKKVKTIFWRHNILGIAPYLKAKTEVRVKQNSEMIDVIGTWYEKSILLPGEKNYFKAGIRAVSPWWELIGTWPGTGSEVVIGTSLAQKLDLRSGDELALDGKLHRISALVETGGSEDNLIFMNLENFQQLKKLPDKISKVLVSALTKPMDEFAYKDPDTMSQLEYEKWYCTAYITSISKQLEEVFQGSTARPIWNIAETEGKILNRMLLLIYFLSFITLIAAALGVSTTMIMSLLRRTEEIGLMKAMGADSKKITVLFLTEGIIIGLTGGLLGYACSVFAATYIGMKVFDTGFRQWTMLLPVSISSAVVISMIGIVLPLKKALKIKPAVVLKGAE
jgi:putative ABC transport system permease protein